MPHARAWENELATGGQILRQVKSHLPPALAEDFKALWKLVVSSVWLAKLPGDVVGVLEKDPLALMAMIFTTLAERPNAFTVHNASVTVRQIRRRLGSIPSSQGSLVNYTAIWQTVRCGLGSRVHSRY